MLAFRVYQRVLYGPLGGRDGHWIYTLRHVGSVLALNEIDAVGVAKRQGFIAPIIGPSS